MGKKPQKEVEKIFKGKEEKGEKRKEKKEKQEKKEKSSKEKKAMKKDTDELTNEEIQKQKRLAPMSKEEWEKQQSVVRRVFDEDTGRMRLVKGTGEILEECVSRDRQKVINKQATQADGESFQRDLS